MLDDEETGYEPTDPKHPTYADRAYDRADQERKRAREGLTNATGNGMIGETATEPEEVPMAAAGRFQVVAVYPSGNRFPVRDPHETRGFAEIHRDACLREQDERDTWTYEIEEVPAQLTTVKRRTDAYPGALSSQAEEGYVIVNAKTGGVMAGPYETEQFADSVRTLCGVMPDTRVAKAMIV